MKLRKLLEAKTNLWTVRSSNVRGTPSDIIQWVIEAPTEQAAREKIPQQYQRNAGAYHIALTVAPSLEFEKKHQLKNIERAKEQLKVLGDILR
jgi:hypothetical protein